MISMSAWWERLAGGALPVIRVQGREVYVSGGAAYRAELVWFRRGLELKYTTPRTPRDVVRLREADQRRTAEQVRRRLAGEPAVQVGDLIPKWATAFLEQCRIVRDSEHTMWKRAEGDERYMRDEDGALDHSQVYDWIAWCAGEWGGGWSTTEGVLDYASLTVMELSEHAAA